MCLQATHFTKLLHIIQQTLKKEKSWNENEGEGRNHHLSMLLGTLLVTNKLRERKRFKAIEGETEKKDLTLQENQDLLESSLEGETEKKDLEL